MRCDACGHNHAGQRWGFICIGCACPERPGTRTPHDCRLHNDAWRCTECQLPIGYPCKPEPSNDESEAVQVEIRAAEIAASGFKLSVNPGEFEAVYLAGAIHDHQEKP